MKIRKKNIINKLIFLCFYFSCFHNYGSKNAFARRAIFSFSVTNKIELQHFFTSLAADRFSYRIFW